MVMLWRKSAEGQLVKLGTATDCRRLVQAENFADFASIKQKLGKLVRKSKMHTVAFG